MREILPGILHFTWFSERHGYDFNSYLVRDPAGNLCIDPVETDDATLEELAAEGVARIILTNRNHFRDAARLKRRTGARVAVHPADAHFVREKGVPVDEALLVGEHLGPLVVVPVPGKSPGEVALHWPARKLLFIGDACVGKPPGKLALLPESVMDDPVELRRALRQLVALDADALLLGDGAPLLSGGRAALEALVATF